MTKKSQTVSGHTLQPALRSLTPKLQNAAELNESKETKLLSICIDIALNIARKEGLTDRSGQVDLKSLSASLRRKTPQLVACFLECQTWAPVVGYKTSRDFGRKLVRLVARADFGEQFSLKEYMQDLDLVHTCAKELDQSLQDCRAGVVAQKLEPQVLMPAIDFFLSVYGLQCFVGFVNPHDKHLWLSSGNSTGNEHSMESRRRAKTCLESFCGMWQAAIDLYTVCYPSQTGPILAACGDAKMSLEKKREMFIKFRGRVQPSARQLEPVGMAMSQIAACGLS